MAMKIGSSYKKEWINKSRWQAFCDDIEYSFSIFRKEFLEMSETLLKTIDFENNPLFNNKDINYDIHNKIKEVVIENIKKLKVLL
jgi:hypothetical protein